MFKNTDQLPWQLTAKIKIATGKLPTQDDAEKDLMNHILLCILSSVYVGVCIQFGYIVLQIFG